MGIRIVDTGKTSVESNVERTGAAGLMGLLEKIIPHATSRQHDDQHYHQDVFSHLPFVITLFSIVNMHIALRFENTYFPK